MARTALLTVSLDKGHRAQWAIVSLCLAAFVATAIIAQVVLHDFPFSEDEFSTLYQARLFAGGRLAADVTDEAFALNQMVLDGKLYSKYEPGWPLLLAAGVIAGLPWLVNPLIGAATLWAIYALGRRLFGEHVALGAAAVCALSPFFLLNSASYYSHPASLLTPVAFVLFYIRAAEGGRRVDALAAGAAIGLGLLVRPFDAFFIALPFALHAFWLAARDRGKRLPQVLLMAATVALFAAALLAYQRLQTGHPLVSPRTLYRDPASIGRDLPASTRPDVSFDLREIIRLNVLGFTPLWLVRLTFWLVPLSAFFVLIALVARKARWERLLWCSAACLAAGYMLHTASGGDGYGPRYYYAALGFIALFAARGVQAAWNWRPRLHPLVAALVVAGVALDLFLVVPARLSVAHDVIEARSSVYRAVEAAGLHNAVVFIDADKPEHNGWFTRNDPAMSGDVIYARYLGEQATGRVMRGLPGRIAYRCCFQIGEGFPLKHTIRIRKIEQD